MEKEDEKFFYEDEVAMVSSKSGLVKYGLVLTTNRTRSDEELKILNKYKSINDIKVMWHPNGAEEVILDDKVVLMDRSLMPGDVVRKVNESKPSQFGCCENIDIFATVKILNTNKVIENVSSRNFTHTKPFAIDSSVFYESWVGGIYDVKCKVTFASQDGSVFTLENPFRQDFISLTTSDSFSIDDNVFYHGQKLKMCLDSLENAKFITMSNLMKCLWHNYKQKYNYKISSKSIKVYVQDITVSSVEVEWYCQTSSNKTKPREGYWPERLITGDNLKKLKTIDLFESCSIQVGDTHWYTIKDTDNLIRMKDWRTKCTEDFNTRTGLLSNKTKKYRHNKLLGTKKPSKNVHFMKYELCDQPTVMLKDDINKESKYRYLMSPKTSEFKPSTSTTGNSSILTLKSNRLKRNRMWKSLVKKSQQFNVPKVSTKPNSNVVVEVCYTKSVVDVVWQDGTREIGVSSTDLYPVQTLDDLEFFPGDFVVENSSSTDVYGVIESVDHTERTARVQWFKIYSDIPSWPNPIEKTDFSVYDLRDHPDFHFKPGCLIIHINPDINPELNTLTAGQVLSARPDGKILVMWVNGEKTECWPQQLFVVKLHDDDDDDGFSFQDEEYDDDDDDDDDDGDDDDDDDDGEDDDDDAPLAIDDDLSEDWMSVPSPGSSNRSHDQENIERFPKLLFITLRQIATGMKSFLETLEHSLDFEKISKLQKSLDQFRLGFNVSSFLPTSETKELETSYRVLMEHVATMMEKILTTLENIDKDGAEGTLSLDTFLKDSIVKLKDLVSDFIDKVNQTFKDLYGSNNKIVLLKHLKKEDQSENNDLYMDVIESALVSPRMELDSTECTSMNVDIDTEAEYQTIAKPEEAGVFEVVETLLDNSHQYFSEKDNNLQSTMLKIITKDIQILQKSLPTGIWVKTFENRMDLFTIMIRGPEKTPYASGLFMFDVKIPSNYPLQPPLCHYYSFCDDRLNPNLYEDGKVCLSLLGTWSGHGVELWSPKDSNLLQLLVSIQGLILVSEPYYNEAGFDSQRGQKLAKENSRVYNEMALIKVVQSMTNMLTMSKCLKVKNTGYFKEEILEHLRFHGPKLINTIESWIKMSEKELTEDEKLVPGYPLLPLSKGFCLSIKKPLHDYKEVLISLNIMFK